MMPTTPRTGHLHALDILRSAAAIVLFSVIMFILLPLIVITNLITLGRATNFYSDHAVPFVLRPIQAVLGIRFRKVMHTDALPEQAMYIFNHASTLDILTILSLGMPRVRYVAKWELQYNPVFFLVGRSTGQIFIRRQRSQKAVHTLQKAAQRLRRHRLSIMMAPEGTRKHDGRIGPFKKGPFRMALDLGLPIVPIYIDGNQELSHGGSLIARPGTSTSHVLPPIDTSSWTVDTLDSHIAEVRNLFLRCDENLEAVLADYFSR